MRALVKAKPERGIWMEDRPVPEIGPEDVLVFLGYDSAAPDAVQPFHTGFDLPDDPQATPRASLEARFFAFYD